VKFDPATYDVYEIGAYNGEPFWREMTPGAVVTFDVPHVPIFWDRPDVQVTAWGAHSPQYARASRPRGLLDQIEARFGGHPAFERDHEACWFDQAHLQRLRDSLVVGAERRSSIVADLAAGDEWRFLLTVMSEPHSIGHHGWHGVLPDHPAAAAPGAAAAGRHVRDVYAAMDDAIGAIAAAAPDATVVVFALHGMQANTNELTSLLMLPELLHRAHYGVPSLRAAPPWWDTSSLRLPAEHHSWGMDVVRLRAEERLERLRRDARVVLPNAVLRAKHALARRLGRPVPAREPFDKAMIPSETQATPDDLAAARVSCDWQPPCWWRSHWAEMPWFALPTYSDGHIRINLEGRERDGVVPRERYDQTCEELATMLHALTNATNGKPAVEDVAFVKRDDPFDPDGPTADVVVIWSEPAYVVRHPQHGRIGPLPFRRTGEHSSNGFLVMSGPDIEPAGDLGLRPAHDVAPTLLHLLGEPVPEGVAGEPLLPFSQARS
jgi:predicted AlkP superfamily phosphohydrolase/phosphomutase